MLLCMAEAIAPWPFVSEFRKDQPLLPAYLPAGLSDRRRVHAATVPLIGLQPAIKAQSGAKGNRVS